MEINQLECCGIQELNGIRHTSPTELIEDLYQDDHTMRHAGIVLFTGAGPTKRKVGYAEALYKFIIKNRLGTITRQAPVRNRNTQNYVSLYIWATNKEAIEKWYVKANPLQTPKKVYDSWYNGNDNFHIR
jgi:hypothetical protein